VNHNADAGGYQGFLSRISPTFSIYTRTISPPHNGAENMKIEKSRFSSEAAPQPNVNTGVINGNDFAAIVPVIAGQIGGREANIASARALHKALGVGRDFTNWIKGRIDQYGFAAGVDYIPLKI
jgi:hypothetical protein